MNRVIHFELPASNPEQSIKFYSEVFGWKFQQWGEYEYWLITTGEGAHGIDGGLMRRKDPQQPVTNTVDVENLDAACAAIEAAGGQIVVPKMPVPGIGWLAYFKDPDGLISGVMQPDASAA